jgi:LuxR family maltose regulon positive regulatory protein
MASAFGDARLVVPPLPPRYVARPRLNARLEAGEDAPLTLVAAGPGTGKTVLLSDWARRHRSPTAWLTATSDADDPVRFWRLLLTALRSIGVVPDDALVAGAETSELLDALFLRLLDQEQPPVLVVDDADCLRHPEVLRGLDAIVRSWPSLLRLVMAARSDPQLPLHRYRLAGHLNEIRAAEMAMTTEEAEELLAAHRVALPAREFELLLRRTEGWTAGLRLSALRMEATEHPAAFVAELAIDHGSVGEYLIDEVIEQQPETVRRLLIETSFLPETTGALARAVTGIDDAEEILTELARTNSFVVPLDAQYSRFRYHQLFAEVLRYLLRRRAPEALRALYSRAAGWFADHGDLPQALRWSLEAEDEQAASSHWLHGGMLEAYLRQEELVAPELHSLLGRADPGPGTASPEVSAVRFFAELLTFDPVDALARLAERRQGTDGVAAGPDIAVAAGLMEISLSRSVGAWDQMERAAARVLDVTELVGPAPGLRPAMLLAQSAARFWQGPSDAVVAGLERASNEAEDGAPVELQADILGMLALVNICRSRPLHANAARARAVELLGAAGCVTTSATLEMAEALRAYVAAELDVMLEAVRRVGMTGRAETDAGLRGLVALTSVALLLAGGRHAEARTALLSAPALTDSRDWIALLRDEALAEAETALGHPVEALRLVERHPATPSGDHLVVARARALVGLGDLKAARGCIRSVLTGTASTVTRFTLIKALLCEAEISLVDQDEPRSLELLAQAIDIANGDVVIPFVPAAERFAGLLERHPTLVERWPVHPPWSAGTSRSELHGPDMVDPLTARERAVLRYLATTMSIAEIAAELYLSVNTVKTHLAAIYRKLPARRRREAVLRARELELL